MRAMIGYKTPAEGVIPDKAYASQKIEVEGTRHINPEILIRQSKLGQQKSHLEKPYDKVSTKLYGAETSTTSKRDLQESNRRTRCDNQNA